MFIAMKGSYQAFYMPSFQNDVTIISGNTSGSTALVIKDIGFTDYVYSRGVVRYLLITLVNKSVIIVYITSAVNNGDGTETLGIGAALASAFNLSQVEKVSYMSLTRFSSDAMEISWITNGWCNISTSFLGVVQ
jgi:hypothetical protein